MKKLFAALCVILSLAVLLCACNTDTDDDKKAEKEETMENVGVPLDEEENTEDPLEVEKEESEEPEEPEKTEEDEKTEEPETPADPENVFFNPSNNILENGNVTIRPRRVHWEGDTLVAECFVINGKDTVVYNIVVEELSFESKADGFITGGSFGALENLSINPGAHAIWTFHFTDVENAGADLSSLGCSYDVSYRH